MFALGNSLFAYGVRNARERSFEEARDETEVVRRLLAPEPRPPTAAVGAGAADTPRR